MLLFFLGNGVLAFSGPIVPPRGVVFAWRVTPTLSANVGW